MFGNYFPMFSNVSRGLMSIPMMRYPALSNESSGIGTPAFTSSGSCTATGLIGKGSGRVG